MSGYRKRRSSDSLEGDRKRISFDRYNCHSYMKQEYNNAQVSGNGRQSYVSVPYNYVAPIASTGIQSAIVCSKPMRYYNTQYVEPYKTADVGNNGINGTNGTNNVISSIRNYSTGYNDILSAAYDNRRQMNFKHEVYINSLRQSEPRIVDFNDLRRHLSDIDIRCMYNWNFSTALELTKELESSLKYFVDTRNELVFLRKLLHQHCIPFTYNEINITNRNGLHDRMKFLDAESAYRSNRMNLLFHQLQSVVIPSIIDDIRYVHSVAYEKSWTNRARYWFSLFKQIKWENGSRVRYNGESHKYQHSKQRRSYRNYKLKDEVDATSNVNVKSEAVNHPKVVKKEKKSNMQSSKNTILHKQDKIQLPAKIDQTMSNIVEKTISSSDCNNNNLASDKNVVVAPAQVVAVETEQPDQESDLSKSFVLVEPNISVVSVPDDDNDDNNGRPDLSNNASPSEGVTEN